MHKMYIAHMLGQQDTRATKAFETTRKENIFYCKFQDQGKKRPTKLKNYKKERKRR